MIVIIDYKMGNLRSVAKAFEKVGAEVVVSSNPKRFKRAKALVLPGVGAFAQGMRHLRELEIIPSLIGEIRGGKPLLGICLGMQLLFSESEEHGRHRGLGIIEGKVKGFARRLKVPHMGWNRIRSNIKYQISKMGFLKEIPNNSYFYFVHSYYVLPKDKKIVLATTEYGVEFASVIQQGNVLGVQFHPEKSQELGLKILKNFMDSVAKT